MKKLISIVLVFCATVGYAQRDSILKLDEVVVSDSRVKQYAEGYKVTVLQDSIIQRTNESLTSLLAFNSNIYFKENGFGMVSSPAFRGTNASHTAVIWNGININSQLNGQVDFNTINPFNYNSISIRSGGGSVQYGSGAIGGSIHLNSDLLFKEHFDNQVSIGYGSYKTKKINFHQSYGSRSMSYSLGVNYNASDNNYKYLNTGEENKNGEFNNLNLNWNIGYVLSENQILKLYHQTFISDRNLSGNLVVLGRSKYKDNQYRTQLEWGSYGPKAISKIKLAYLQEEYKYFENKDAAIYSFGKVSNFLARYSLDYKISKFFRLNSFLEFNNYKGAGDSFGSPERDDFSATALLKHIISSTIAYNLSVRQDFSSDFSSPLVFSFDGSYSLTDNYQVKINASKNFRTPTFNDLYWQPGGNLELIPEKSYQLDFGNVLNIGAVSMQYNGYYISTKDMIKWLPNNEGVWSPINIDDVEIYGAEAKIEANYSLGKNQELGIKTNYAYTVSEDKSTNEQLIYVPFHTANGSLEYRIADLNLFYQHLYNGSVSIVGGELKEYQVANLGATYTADILKKDLKYTIGVTVNNVFNTYYENVALRPMPNRNIQTQLILNF
ncbi:MAG TPA: TonB-dependent receptor [Maribacter sp.]|uniref:TonB-dependent receptor plug domain-containing protein n=1 Tax=unclassified Maribacter TaxID=2615042 RepID=UPI000EE469A5|nr:MULTISPECIES: TonB-dependent receptor [unclassified Maribacter]HAF77793.1 TonB-dependent receptor [Maribacter sp.]|tara:strand:- start:220172 stop:221998 length:1827 start_codon:yes stop_codon:yes gene_type:complete